MEKDILYITHRFYDVRRFNGIHDILRDVPGAFGLLSNIVNIPRPPLIWIIIVGLLLGLSGFWGKEKDQI